MEDGESLELMNVQDEMVKMYMLVESTFGGETAALGQAHCYTWVVSLA